MFKTFLCYELYLVSKFSFHVIFSFIFISENVSKLNATNFVKDLFFIFSVYIFFDKFFNLFRILYICFSICHQYWQIFFYMYKTTKYYKLLNCCCLWYLLQITNKSCSCFLNIFFYHFLPEIP